MFFTAKTHKTGCPFRVVVTEKGPWQGAMSRFLLRQLSHLHLDDPFLVKNSAEVICYLEQDSTTAPYGFSLDVEDLFYSIPHNKLFTAVGECIEANGSLPFQTQCGMPVESFLELLRFHLSATVVTFDCKTYIQKKGICRGSCVAPILCDIFLSQCDREIANRTSTKQISRIF
ncbi:unnamed protein product [Ixodes hexagonus]